MEVPHANEGLVSDFRDCITSDYVSEPGQSLPELASELAYAKEAQFTELHSKEEIVRRLTEELQHEKQRLAAVQRQIASTAKAICLAKDEAETLGAECSQLMREIEQKTSIIEGQRLNLRRVQQEQQSLESIRGKYKEKIVKYSTKIQEVEHKSAVQQELEAAMDKLRKLREKIMFLILPYGFRLLFPFFGTELEYLSGEGLAIFDGQRQEVLLDQKAKIDATRELLEEENAILQNKVACQLYLHAISLCFHACECVCVCVLYLSLCVPNEE